MKLLFDQNLSFKLCRQLGDLFPGSSQVQQVGLAMADDLTVWQYAGSNGFVLYHSTRTLPKWQRCLGHRRK